MLNYYKQLREELERRSCTIRTGYAVQSVFTTDAGKLLSSIYMIADH